MTATSLVGIVANPASGKDIRRLVAHGSTFDNNEKINIVRRVLLALDALGVDAVRYMPDAFGIVSRAARSLSLSLDLAPLPMNVLNNPGDTLEATRRLVDLGAKVVVTLGGDGTNRMVAKGSADVPLVAISTGTNNVFPRMIEGTIAGTAAGLVALNLVDETKAVYRAPRLDVIIDGTEVEIALIDVVTSHHAWIGARALWDPAYLREAVISRISPSEIGICGLGGLLHPDSVNQGKGVHVRVGSHGRIVRSALAPGLIFSVPIVESRVIDLNELVTLESAPGTIALDGERELEILQPGHELNVLFHSAGPRVVDVETAIRLGAIAGAFTVARFD